jgi:hypothetical protein
MKSTRYSIALAVLAVSAQLALADPLGTAFTYQGRLTQGGSAANGSYDLRFILYDAEFGGSQQGNILTNSAVAVSGGLFTTALDFGATAFGGKPEVGAQIVVMSLCLGLCGWQVSHGRESTSVAWPECSWECPFAGAR